MTSASAGDVGRHLRQLFGTGSGVGLTDGQLLERFASAGRGGESDTASAEAAFETILARHGSTVLSVCRQVLGDGHAAEDAFQATFLVLVRRAGSLQVREDSSLGAWLHGVAYRTALKARKGAARRRAREHRVARPEARAGLAVLAVERDDLGAALHTEVTRLPAKYRAPVVLCYFEGRTHDEAAAVLSWRVGTVRSRLSRARDLLRRRLTRRGLAPAALSTALVGSAVRAEVPAPMLRATLDAAVRGAPAPAATALADVVLKGLIASRLRTAVAAVLGLVVMAAGLAFVLRGSLALPSSRPRPADPAPAPVAATPTQPAPVERRGDPLPVHARARLGTSAFHHGSIVNEAFFARDGKTLVTCDIKRVVGIWDAATGRLLHRMALSGELFGPIVLSPDGSTLATTEPDPDRGLRLWDVATGRERRRWHRAKDDQWGSHAFTPDGKMLITFARQTDEKTRQVQAVIELRDVVQPDERPRRLVGHWSEIGLYKVSPDGTMLAGFCCTSDPTPTLESSGFPTMPAAVPDHVLLRIVEFPSRRERTRVRIGWLDPRSIAFSPDSRYLAVALSDGTVRVYDTANGRERLPRLGLEPMVGPELPQGGTSAAGRREVIDCLAFSPDGSILAGGSCLFGLSPSPGSLYLWDFARGNELRRIEGFRTGPSSLAFAPDGKTMATAGTWEPIVRLWDVATGLEAFPQDGHVMGVSSIAVSPADGTVFTGSYDGTIRRWDPSDGRHLGLVARLNSVFNLAVAPDGRTLIACGQFGDPVLWSVTERRQLHRLPGTATSGISSYQVACSPDGRTVAYGRTIWDAASGKLRTTLRPRDEPKDAFPSARLIFYTPDGRRAITVEQDVARTWDLASGAEAATPIPIRGEHAAFSADGRFLATGGFLNVPTNSRAPDSSIRVWELASGRQVATMPGHEKSICGVALSPDGRLLASFRPNQPSLRDWKDADPQDPTIRIWDVAKGRELRRLEGHRGAVNAVVFTPDGRSLISAGEDATALVWDVSDLRDR